jgi:hypothetical protein
VVSDEGAPGLTATARRLYVPHVLLNRAFADANTSFRNSLPSGPAEVGYGPPGRRRRSRQTG